MSDCDFILQPFPASEHPPPRMNIRGLVARRSNTLAISYALHGLLADLMIPAPADRPHRKDGLWRETCLELFFAVKGSKRYWEFNLSPSGNWNVYRFADYRRGMQEETAVASLPFSVRSTSQSLTVSMNFSLAVLLPADHALELAISAVIQQRSGETSYWALTHCGPQADFHRRDGFIMKL